MLIRTLSLLLLAATATAGTKLETVNRDLSGARTTTINTWAQGGMMRVETQPNESTMIFKDDTIYAISHKDKSYIAMDRASMKRMAEQLNPALQMLQERMKTMTPEQRAQMEKMLGGQLPGGAEKKQEIKRTSRNDKINGYSCTFVEVREDGVLTDELCVVPGNAMQGSAELMASARKLAAVMDEMLSSVDMPWLKQMSQKQMQNFEALGGIPVMSRHFQDGKPQSETTLSNITSEAFAATVFEIPAGYTKKDMLAPR
ncbi:DUF4412 domain-containing protein [Steroidobacter sp. S1-65]|uniref:DUF4412 domain-containing protein n=1 Tax=Steroidobacter gossypii TaxID=2805490 RepID=A0ABS1WRM3_9GAMM|nr:DUF4412 domain-containing protein [Steroidobacter gossypii]MBM0103618.1 DUF4412 domain-containing protein [Steroidobacter gossypii]